MCSILSTTSSHKLTANGLETKWNDRNYAYWFSPTNTFSTYNSVSIIKISELCSLLGSMYETNPLYCIFVRYPLKSVWEYMKFVIWTIFLLLNYSTIGPIANISNCNVVKKNLLTIDKNQINMRHQFDRQNFNVRLVYSFYRMLTRLNHLLSLFVLWVCKRIFVFWYMQKSGMELSRQRWLFVPFRLVGLVDWLSHVCIVQFFRSYA